MNKILLQLRLLLIKDGAKKAEYLKKKNLFHKIGENVFWQPISIPSEPYLVSIGNNVNITAGVRFITHDVIQTNLKRSGKYPVLEDNLFYMGKIDIKDNVVIGADSIIMYDVTIESDSIIAAGSVVTHDVPSGKIVGGVPAKVIGDVKDLASKRFLLMKGRPNNKCTLDEINNFFWNENE